MFDSPSDPLDLTSIEQAARGAGEPSRDHGAAGGESLAEADLAACQRLLVGGSRSFLAASRILPREIARAACALYAFCRLADDSVDASPEAGSHEHVRGGALADLHERLDRIYAGTPRALAADRAFTAVVERYRIPHAWPHALLEGFEWDAQGRQYEDLPQVRAYAARVAGSVGAMMARVMGVQSRAALARACELGIAMQLTNIARDVGDDARLGRLYLPRSWMRESGIDPDAWLQQPRFTPALGAVVRRLLDEAQLRYRAGASGIGSLPLGCRPGIHAASLLYADIGRTVQTRGFDSVNARAVVGAGRKAQLVAWAALACLASGVRARTAPPSEIEFLLDAPGAAAPPAPGPSSSIHTVLEIFERLERRDRSRSDGFGAAALS
jgi:phytoene synthase